MLRPRHGRSQAFLLGGGGQKGQGAGHGGKASFPFPPLSPFPFPSLPSLFPFFSSSLRSRHTQLRLEGLGERSSSPSGFGRSPAAKRILAHFRPKFAPF